MVDLAGLPPVGVCVLEDLTFFPVFEVGLFVGLKVAGSSGPDAIGEKVGAELGDLVGLADGKSDGLAVREEDGVGLTVGETL